MHKCTLTLHCAALFEELAHGAASRDVPRHRSPATHVGTHQSLANKRVRRSVRVFRLLGTVSNADILLLQSNNLRLYIDSQHIRRRRGEGASLPTGRC